MLHIKKFTFNPFSENTYILYNEHKYCLIIDPGNYHKQETHALRKFIQTEQLMVKNILLTHAHIDHVLGLQWCFDYYNVPVLLHQMEEEILKRNPMTAQQYGLIFKPFEGETIFLKEGDSISLNNDHLSVLHVPGHAPGHIAYYCKDQDFIISGDVLFQSSIGRTDLYKGDPSVLIQSIKTKLLTLPEITLVFCGHGEHTCIGFEKKHNPFLN